MGEIKGGHGEEEGRTSPEGRRGGGGWELSSSLSFCHSVFNVRK
jgi:hypothetical protein